MFSRTPELRDYKRTLLNIYTDPYIWATIFIAIGIAFFYSWLAGFVLVTVGSLWRILGQDHAKVDDL